MKICAIICEFNPFHNGHKYILNKARALSGCDAVLCIMSGNFTQRGEICVLDKFTRARHAVSGGADCVIQLPAPFAVAPAEIFAAGAIKILSSIPDVTMLVFGSECGDGEKILDAARLAVEESQSFKATLAEKLDGGESYIKGYCEAFSACGGDTCVLQSPNDVLGLEYAKAIIKSRSGIEILPIKRVGSGYNDEEIGQNFSSASAIRKNTASPLLKGNVPDYVYEDLENAVNARAFGDIQKYALIAGGAKALSRVTGCGEGLENKLHSLSGFTAEEIIEKATSKRYSSSRIRRILTCNALKLYEKDCKEFLGAELYIKPLAINAGVKGEMLNALSRSPYPAVIRKRDLKELSESAQKCFEKDLFESRVFGAASGKSVYDFTLLTI